jgi:hypothetical protein
MDSNTRQREGADAGAHQQSVTGRRHTGGRNDHPEVARLAAAEGHSEEIRYVRPPLPLLMHSGMLSDICTAMWLADARTLSRREHGGRDARLKLGVTNTATDTVIGQQHAAVVEPPALRILTKRVPSIRSDPRCIRAV